VADLEDRASGRPLRRWAGRAGLGRGLAGAHYQAVPVTARPVRIGGPDGPRRTSAVRVVLGRRSLRIRFPRVPGAGSRTPLHTVAKMSASQPRVDVSSRKSVERGSCYVVSRCATVRSGSRDRRLPPVRAPRHRGGAAGG
jgi:hypothetical protein